MIGALRGASLARMGTANATVIEAPGIPSPTPADPLMELLPGAATATHQAVEVDAPAAVTSAAIRDADLARAPLLRALVRLRALPGKVSRRLRGQPPLPPDSASIGEMIANGWWLVLAETSRELCLGVVLWDERVTSGGLSRPYFDRPAPGAVRVGWSLRVEPLPGDRCLLVTETRADPVDDAARRRFHTYWTLVAPFAAFTRRLTLRGIRATAERRAKVRA